MRKTFSLPVSSGWKPVPSSSIGQTRPSTLAVPWVGLSTPAMIPSKVLFPEPFGPTRPTASPRPTLNDTSLSAQNSS